MTGSPLVSCVMATRDRRAFARQAIWYFLRQDYPRRELIVLDDGDERIEDLACGDERIRYVPLPRRTPVGAKRNLGRELARGELVAHWDDDDWMGPSRLSRQVGGLLAGGADVCGAHTLLHYRVNAGDAWLLRARWPEAPDIPAGSLLYRRAAAAGRAFAADETGEQRPFLRAFEPGRVLTLDSSSWYVAVVHGANLSHASLDDGRWTPHPFHAVHQRLGDDGAFYAGLRDRTRRGADPPPRPTGADVTIAASFRPWDGYGLMAEYMALGMQRAGAVVGAMPLDVDHAGMSDELRALLAGSHGSSAGPVLWLGWPESARAHVGGTRELFLNTMWESDALPPGWAEAINDARGVVVPSRHVAKVFRREGVSVPVEVVPQGADPALYPYVERPEREGITTLVVGVLVPRKHVAEAVAGWQRAFAGDPAARLILKGKLGQSYAIDDPRIEVAGATDPTRGIAHTYARADVLLALGNEGFGLPLVEGMATGLPVVALNSEGQRDVCADAGELVLDVPPERWERCADTHFGPVGVRGVPGVAAVAERLRWVATHRDEATELGRRASAWAHRERNVWTMGPATLDAMERRVRRPLRRTWTLWPTDASSLRPYVSALVAGVDRVRVVSAPPPLSGMRLLHVQHAGDPDDGPATAAHVVAAAVARVPVAVTAHAVRGRVGAWERDASVLVATTKAEAAVLRSRWPSKWVEWIPCGCPPALTFDRRPGDAVAIVGAAPEVERSARRAGRHVVLLAPGERPQPELARYLAERSSVVAFADAAASPLDLAAALASGTPVVAAPDPRLDDLGAAIHQEADVSGAVLRLLEDGDLRERLGGAALEYCHDQSWQRVTQRHVALWTALEAM